MSALGQRAPGGSAPLSGISSKVLSAKGRYYLFERQANGRGAKERESVRCRPKDAHPGHQEEKIRKDQVRPFRFAAALKTKIKISTQSYELLSLSLSRAQPEREASEKRHRAHEMHSILSILQLN